MSGAAGRFECLRAVRLTRIRYNSGMASHTSDERRAWLRHYEANGRNASATARYFGVARSTLVRWLARYDPDHPVRSLKPQSRRPHRTKAPTYSLLELAALSEIARRQPRWGAGRLRAALASHGVHRSRATVGRMLAAIYRRCPVCKGKGGRHDAFNHEVLHPFAKRFDLARLHEPPKPSRRRHAKTVSDVEGYLAEANRHRDE